MRWVPCGVALATLFVGADLAAQQQIRGNWIWYDEGNPMESAPPGTVWFRHEVRAFEPSTGMIRIAADNRFVVWVNGVKIGEGGGTRGFRFLLSGIVERGINVIAVEATNDGGRAGLLVDGEIRGQGGHSIAFRSGAEWTASKIQPAGNEWKQPRFRHPAWQPAKVLAHHDQSPWKSINFEPGYLDRFQATAGFELRRVAEPNLVGSIVAITWGNRGRLFASRERGPVLSLVDTDADGKYDKTVEYTAKVTNCQGLCTIDDDLYLVGNGPNGTGVYRLPDRNHDDRADEVVALTRHRGEMGEHGPHNIVLGPDGWLYHNVGNHAWITQLPEPTSPVRHPYEGDLLQPRLEDAGGHAVNIKAPGGTVWRFTPDGKKWWMHTNGFRNHYDIAFNAAGELFTFDSDMEWDVGLPWYRPVRVNHCTAGAEFGWRSGAAKWPPYYFDSLPGTVDIGRGSPTGVVFYEHHQFPAKYHGSFLVCDWSMGRIIAVFLEPHGASFGGRWETLVTGNPLNVSDIEVDRDGSVVFSTGGRNTEGGIYRLRYHAGSAADAARPTSETSSRTVHEALTMPQPSSAWAREAIRRIKQSLGATWEPDLQKAARHAPKPELRMRALSLLAQFGPGPPVSLLSACSRDDDPAVRAFAAGLLGDHPSPQVASDLARLLDDLDARVQRRACESFVRSGLEPPVEPLLRLLGHDDRWLRFSARLAIERVPVAKWRRQVLEATNPRVAVHGLLALHRLGPQALAASLALEKEAALLETTESPESAAEVLRMIELTMLSGGMGAATSTIGKQLLERFPTGYEAFDREAARLLVFLQVPETAEKLTQALSRERYPSDAIHFALCLRYLRHGWTVSTNRALMNWYESTHDWEGGHSFQGYLANIMAESLHHFPPEELADYLNAWPKYLSTARLLLERARPEQIRGFPSVIERLLTKLETRSDLAGREQLTVMAIAALGRSSAPESQALLRRLYDEQPDRRGPLARSLAAHPSPDNWPYLLRSLEFADRTTLQVCLSALAKVERKAEKPEEFRAVIRAGLKLGESGGLTAANLLEKWTGNRHRKKSPGPAVAHYQQWFREKYPNEPEPELPRNDTAKNKYSLEHLAQFLDREPSVRLGDPVKGKQIFTKVNCFKCHRMGDEGESVGPDLTTLRRRFQRKEILEAILFPSAIISDQYRSVAVATTDGLIHTGMYLPSPPDKVILLLSDATRLEIPKKEIETLRPSKTSVMPESQLNELSLEEIADLFAFLETSKHNPEPEKK
jgi:putative membrane-bound dehydrogenase-like protein